MPWFNFKRKLQRTSNLEAYEPLPATFPLQTQRYCSLLLTASFHWSHPLPWWEWPRPWTKNWGNDVSFHEFKNIHFSPWICVPLGCHFSQLLSPYPLHFLAVQHNRKAQPDYIRTDSFTLHPQKLIFLPKDSHLLPWWWIIKHLKWKSFLILNQSYSI